MFGSPAAGTFAHGVPNEIKHLPGRLLRFFYKYPPHLYSAEHTGIAIPLTRREAKELKATAQDAAQTPDEPTSKITQSEGQTTTAILPNPDEATSHTESPTSLFSTATTDGDRIVDGTSRATRFPPNPFLPFRHPTTGHWSGARISLRNQADLVKLAKKNNVESLLPPGRKSTAFKEARVLQRGLRVKGTGEGQRVKGHQWERRLPELLQKRQKALEEMPALVREWQARGHGRGWKQWPKVRGPR